MSGPILSACICTYNGADRIADALWSLVRQSASPEQYEILVIDNASDDPSAIRRIVEDFVAQGHPVGLVREPNLGLAHAKNRALAESRGAYIYFLDDDAIANARLVQAYLEAIAEHRPDVLGGNVQPWFESMPPDELDYSCWEMWSLRDFGSDARWMGEGRDQFFLGGNLCFARDILDKTPHDPKLGRVGEHLAGGEEWYLGDPAFRRRFVPGAFIFHQVPDERTQMDHLQRMIDAPSPASGWGPASGVARFSLPGSLPLRAWLWELGLFARKLALQARIGLAIRSLRRSSIEDQNRLL
jgi:glycosyltransferase involved in cell wall biosynthesis